MNARIITGLSIGAAVLFVVGGLAGQTVGPDDNKGAQQSAPGEALVLNPESGRVTDPSGDARQDAPAGLSYVGECPLLCSQLAVPDHDAGSPAPHLDIEEANFVDNGSTLRVELGIRQIGLGFGDLTMNAGIRKIAHYDVCWSPSALDADRCAQLFVTGAPAESKSTSYTAQATFEIRTPDCSEDPYRICMWSVPVRVKFGTPGTIAFDIPKELVAFDGAPLAVQSARGFTRWFVADRIAPGWHTAGSLEAEPPAGDFDHTHEHVGVETPWGFGDVMESQRVGLVLGPAVGKSTIASSFLARSSIGNVYASGTQYDIPELDMVDVELEEEADQVTAVVRMASYDTPLFDHHLLALVGLNGEVFEFGFIRQGSNGPAARSFAYAGKCGHIDCHERQLVEVDYEIVPDEDAVRISIPRAVLHNPQAGDVTTYFGFASFRNDAYQYLGEYGTEPQADYHSAVFVDRFFGGEPFVFRLGDAPRLGSEPHGHG